MHTDEERDMLRYELEIEILKVSKEKMKQAAIEKLSERHVNGGSWQVDNQTLDEMLIIDDMIKNLQDMIEEGGADGREEESN